VPNDRQPDTQQPGSHASPITHVDDIGHRAHGAETGFIGNKTKNQRQKKACPGNDQCGVFYDIHLLSPLDSMVYAARAANQMQRNIT
jgi:hypothetical protein